MAVLNDLVGEIAIPVWPKSTTPGLHNYIEQARFSQIKRRVAIARPAVPELDAVDGYKCLTLESRRLLCFKHVLEILSRHLISLDLLDIAIYHRCLLAVYFF